MKGYFHKVDPNSTKTGFPLKEIYKDFGNGDVYGEVDLNSLSTPQKIDTLYTNTINNIIAPLM